MLEISERSSIADFATFVKAKRSFTDRGFEVAVDNLGSCYSGLENVAQLQPDYLS